MAKAGVGIQVFSPTGTGTQQRNDQVIFTTKYPFAKLDTTNLVSFQNIRLFFATEPPGVEGSIVSTTVYSFKHGYTKPPTYWLLYQNLASANTAGSFAYGQEGSVIVSPIVSTFAQLKILLDDTTAYIQVEKTWTMGGPAPLIAGTTLLLRIYIFVEPVLSA